MSSLISLTYLETLKLLHAWFEDDSPSFHEHPFNEKYYEALYGSHMSLLTCPCAFTHTCGPLEDYLTSSRHVQSYLFFIIGVLHLGDPLLDLLSYWSKEN